MNFIQFKSRFADLPVFSTSDINKEWPGFNFDNLIHWQDKGYLLKMRNTFYAFPEALKTESDLYFLANRLQRPSYVSLETALRFYDFIPESVFTTTSVTTSKPAEWQTPVGHFSYRSVKPGLFFGFQVMDAKPVFLMAEPEKALLDMLYFNPKLTGPADFAGLRLNKAEILEKTDPARFKNHLALIASPTLEKRWRGLQTFLAP